MKRNRRTDKKKCAESGNISIKWRLAAYLALFTAVLIAVLWLFQIVLLNDFYRYIKINEITGTADVLKKNIELDKEPLDDLIGALSVNNMMCIEVVSGSSFQTIAAAEFYPNCILSQLNQSGDYSTGTLWLPRSVIKMQLLDSVRQSGEVYFREFADKEQSEQKHAAASQRNSSLLYIEYVETAGGEGRYILLNSVITPVNSTVHTLQAQLQLVCIFFVIIAICMAFLLSRRISTPIIKINRTAKELAKGNYAVSFDGKGYREIAELNDTLNHAASELSKVDRLKNELIANISHDLRTPLTMIIGYGEIMRDLPGENTPENVQVIIDEATRLTTLVNDILDLSKLQADAQGFTPSYFSLTDCVLAIIKRFQKLKESDGYHIEFTYSENVTVFADEIKLQQVIYNLISNAVYYTGEDKQVKIKQTVYTDKNAQQTVKIDIIDTGTGISPENLPYIWDRYFKENKTHKRAVMGSGLGLSIVKNVLELHHAKYGVMSSEAPENHGSDFWFELTVQGRKELPPSTSF